MAVPPGHRGDARRPGDVLEGAVPTVAEQAIAGSGGLQLGREGTALDEVDVEPAVAVDIDQADAAAGRDRGDQSPRGATVLLDEGQSRERGVVDEARNGQRR